MKEHFGGDSNGVLSLNEELAKYSKKYPYEILVKKIVPEGVDVINKEVRNFTCDLEGGGAMTTFGDLGNYVNGFACSPHEI